MSIETGKITPLVLFMAGIGYALWPYLDAPRPVAGAEGGARKADDIAFRPDTPLPARRDPFVTGSPTKVAASPKVAPRSSTVSTASKDGVEKKSKAPAATPAPRNRSIDGQAEGLKLGATVVGDRKQAAVINGRLYTPGDVVNSSESSANSWRVVAVSDDGVLLADRLAKRVVTLGFRTKEAAKGGPAAQKSDPAMQAEILELIGVLDGMMGTDIKSLMPKIGGMMPLMPQGGK